MLLNLQKNSLKFIPSDKYNLSDVIEFYLKENGESEIWLTAYSISDMALRRLFNLKQEGLINALHCLYDKSILKNKFHLIEFAGVIANDMGFIENHSKIICFKNEKIKTVLFTSANLTDNKRLETFIFSTQEEIFEQAMKIFEEYKTKGFPL